jgi:hypothetical protein
MAKSAVRRRRRISKPAVSPDQPASTLDEAFALVDLRSRQVDLARQIFLRLATFRAADLVKYEGKSWDDGAAYINAELQGLDAELNKLQDQPPPPTT